MRYYKVCVGYEGVPLETHIVGGHNLAEVRLFALNKYLSPDKGFNYLSIKLIKRGTAQGSSASNEVSRRS